jgi:hypothetical protein
MGIQELVLVPGFSRGTGNAANMAQEAVRAAAAMRQADESELKAELAQLRQEHRDLDAAIEALHSAPGSDLLQVQRLKKRKLHLRDRIIQIEDQLTPDIIA